MTVVVVAALAICSSSGLPVMASALQQASREVAASTNRGAVQGDDGWWFLQEELVHLSAGRFWGDAAATASRSSNPGLADPIPAIVDYHHRLAEQGISLYLLPVPPKALVYPDKLGMGLDLQAAAEDLTLYQDFYRILAEQGVQVIDLLPKLLDRRDEADLYCRSDSHYSGVGLQLFAEAVAEVITAQPWYPDVVKQDYRLTDQEVTIIGDLARMAGSEETGETLTLSLVSGRDGQPVVSDPASPVILLGDSHTLVFHAGGDLHARGAGLFDHLSARLGFPVDLIGVRGSGITPARINLYQRVRQDGSSLQGKKVLIWCFAARDFTGSGGWREIPVVP